jgi:hypothetical protein
MKIISHRGYWLEASEKNTEVAFRRSFDLGFGTETDVRDCAGQLLISHDMPSGKEMTLEAFLDILAGRPLPLAINIKADGLSKKLLEILQRYRVADAFVFDMSVPDLLQQLKNGVPSFTRLSEYEREPSCYDQAAGVWLDAFKSVWYDFDLIKSIVAKNKRVCLVSPELHGRPCEELWDMLRANKAIQHPQIILCTDLPEKAQAFFGTA